MAEASLDASGAENPATPLDLSRPGSSERKSNLWVRSPPFLDEEKAKALEKGGLLSGLAPPSQIFDGSLPLVELEANRFQEAMAWVYDSVRTLNQQSTAVDTRLTNLQELMQHFNSTPTEVPDEPQDRVPTPRAGDAETPSASSLTTSAMKRMLLQLECKRTTSEKLIEMRLDSLKCDVDQRLQGKDLQDHKNSFSEQLENLQAKSREDVRALGSMIHTESAAERRRIQSQVEVVSGRLTKQMELTEKLLKESTEKNLEFAQQLETRLQACEGQGALQQLEAQKSLEVAQQLQARLAAAERSQVTARSASKDEAGSRRGSLGLSVGDDARVAYLEAAVSQVEARMKDLADREATAAVEAMKDATAARTQELSDSSLHDLVCRLGKLESRIESLDSSGTCAGPSEGEDAQRQLVELHRGHTEMHRQILDTGVRLQQLEQVGVANPGGGVDPKMVMEVAGLSTRIVRHDQLHNETHKKIDEFEQKRVVNHGLNASSIAKCQQDLATLVRYITGESSLGGDDRLKHECSKDGEWPLAWMEKRIEALIAKKGGMTLEARLGHIEKAMSESGSSDTGSRLKKLEQALRGIDVRDLAQVRPDLSEHQRHQEVVSGKLAKEMNELKVLVGCVEACIPRETRKAVQLFKRASGSGEGLPLSPREFSVDSKILALREEISGQISDATNSLESNRNKMTVAVKNLERKQEMLESHLEDVRSNRPHSQPATLLGKLSQPRVPELPKLGELRQTPDPGKAPPPDEWTEGIDAFA